MALYAMKRFRNVGITNIDNPPIVVHDVALVLAKEPLYAMGSIDMLRTQLEKLEVGSSTIVALLLDAEKSYMVKEGYRVTRVPEYKSGEILFDEQAKEFVKVSNGICVLDHTSEGFREAHGENGMGSCIMAPHEAIALRPLIGEDGSIAVAWTYRGVNAAYLSRTRTGNPDRLAKEFAIALNPPKEQRKQFAGRV